MAELAFVGLGLGDERGLSQVAWDALRRADRVFAEEYTAVAPEGTLDRIGSTLGRPVSRLGRAELESETPILDALARHARVALLVVGDPFAATTHVALRLAVERAGHTTRYVPGPSILTAAAGLLGISHYRFGRTVSVPFPAPDFEPRSPLEQIAGNRERDLHTLVLLDLDPGGRGFLTADRALALLRALDPEGQVLPGDALVAVVARVGRDEARAWVGRADALATLDFGAPPHALLVLAPRLHFEEAAALRRFATGPDPRLTTEP
jgi:diphthine synthase